MSYKGQPILAFGAHPDDIEFGVGGVIARETQAGRKAHFIVCSGGESATHGSSAQRVAEATESAKLLGATIEFIELDGDAHFEHRAEHAVKLAALIRQLKPSTLLAPTYVENQHPDHGRLGKIVRDAARLARYGGVQELREMKPHAIEQLFFYAVTPEGEPDDVSPVWVDVSPKEVISAWTRAMNAHASQASARNYVELQLTRAKLLGTRAGIEHAIALWPSDPMVIESLDQAGRGARRF